jgi:CRISPR/Cas system endoribonuclease Cas6 (RAMP superfamily)
MFVNHLFDILQVLARKNIIVNIGHMRFKIDYLKKIYTMIPGSNIDLITGTPIVIEIDKQRYERRCYPNVGVERQN